MTLTPLTAVSPVDGRYRRATAVLSDYFSEGALIRYRVRVEVEYFIALCRLPLPQLAAVDPAIFDRLRETWRTFTIADAARIKEIEKNHQPRCQSGGVFRQGDLRPAGPVRIQGVHPLRPDLSGHQQHGHAPVAEGGLADGDAADPAGNHRGPDCQGPGLETGAHAGPHPRPARFAHPIGQGDSRVCGSARATVESAGNGPLSPPSSVAPPGISMPTTWPTRTSTGLPSATGW